MFFILDSLVATESQFLIVLRIFMLLSFDLREESGEGLLHPVKSIAQYFVTQGVSDVKNFPSTLQT